MEGGAASKAASTKRHAAGNETKLSYGATMWLSAQPQSLWEQYMLCAPHELRHFETMHDYYFFFCLVFCEFYFCIRHLTNIIIMIISYMTNHYQNTVS